MGLWHVFRNDCLDFLTLMKIIDLDSKRNASLTRNMQKSLGFHKVFFVIFYPRHFHVVYYFPMLHSHAASIVASIHEDNMKHLIYSTQTNTAVKPRMPAKQQYTQLWLHDYANSKIEWGGSPLFCNGVDNLKSSEHTVS